MNKLIGTAALVAIVALPGAVSAPRVYAQTPTDNSTAGSSSTDFPDIPANHWAYADVHDLADKGLVKGYPNGEFLGSRTMTRYEFATIIDRMVQTIEDMQSGITAKYATQDDLNKLQVLVDTFQPQLDAIQSSVTKDEADITALRGELDDLRIDVQDAKDLANKAQATADNSYGESLTPSRKFQISGYVQARYIAGSSDSQSGSKFTFPHGTTATSSPYNGTYMAGTDSATAEVRRSRLKFVGNTTPNTKYVIQIDMSSNSSATPVTVREGNVNYTFSDGNAKKNPTFTMGLFANPFGFVLPQATNVMLTPEKPLAFNDGSAGIFASQDYDKGAQIAIPDGRTKLTVAVINGTGYTSIATSRMLDQVYKLGYVANGMLSADVSYYNGHLPYSATAGFDQKKQLTDADVQVKPTQNIVINGEWDGGPYEQIVYDNGTGLSTITAPGNKINGYYVMGGYIFDPSGNHPLEFGASYDELQRSASGFSGANALAYGGSGANWTDENVGYGILYNLDKSSRLRVWYTDPNKVAHPSAAGKVLSPPNDGLLTTEYQVSF